jgi:hypothetical protein
MALDVDSFAKDVKVLGLLPTSIGADGALLCRRRVLGG